MCGAGGRGGDTWWERRGLPSVPRDGQPNPEISDYDRLRFEEFCRTVDSLALAYAATGDERFRAILSEAREAGLISLTVLVRPWVAAALVGGLPVELRAFVSGGGVSVTSYHQSRPLGEEWLPQAERAAALALRLRPYVPAVADYSADFLVTEAGEVLLLEGGPPCCYGADPCLLGPEGPFGDGRIVLG